MQLRGGLRTALAATTIGLGTYGLSKSILPGEIPAVTVSLLLGVTLGSFLQPDAAMASSIIKRVLPIAIVLIGLRVSFEQIRALGIGTLALVVAGLVVGLGAATLAARWVGVPHRLGILLALGTAVCGNTAIVSAAPIIRTRREEVAYAVATITAFGTAAVLVFPPLGHALGLTDTQFGIWSGIGVNDTSQVVATAFAYSNSAGETATVVKLVRNMFLGAVLFGVAFVSTDSANSSNAPGLRRPRLGIPWFVWGFVAAAAFTSVGAVPERLRSASEPLTTGMILVVMAAVGLSTRISAMRAAGARPFVVGLTAMGCLSAFALIAILLGVGS